MEGVELGEVVFEEELGERVGVGVVGVKHRRVEKVHIRG